MKNLTRQNPEQLFVAQELINKVKSKCCGIKVVILRNCLAHHARVWNRRFPQMPQLSIRARGNWIDNIHVRPNKLYAQICCLAYLLDSIYPQNDFKAQVKNLLNEHPEINIHYMGFPNDWENQPLWM